MLREAEAERQAALRRQVAEAASAEAQRRARESVYAAEGQPDVEAAMAAEQALRGCAAGAVAPASARP